jgi:hypothetical protein
MAECHPVGFQWVMEAKVRGATVIHVDPRFTRTSAVADLHVPLRAGSDIVFLGGIINYVLASEKYFRDQVRDLRGGHGLGPGPEVHDRAPAANSAAPRRGMNRQVSLLTGMAPPSARSGPSARG